MSQWQPIETAPKDGTRVLAFGKDQHDEDLICSVYWYTHVGNFFEPVKGSDLYREKKYENSWWEGTGFTPWHPTHWMPLPEPPEAA